MFFFSLIYGYLQELVIVHLFDRKLSIFLANVQFFGYCVLGKIFSIIGTRSEKRSRRHRSSSGADGYFGLDGNDLEAGTINNNDENDGIRNRRGTQTQSSSSDQNLSPTKSSPAQAQAQAQAQAVPIQLWIVLGFLRAIDLGLTNASLRYINYPVKTLLKSSRVIFTMTAGVIVMRKKHRRVDFLVVGCMVSGLIIFMRADAAVTHEFSWLGIVMVLGSLIIDSVIVNFNEDISNRGALNQDEFIFR